jgi:hypothetical protein
VAEDTYVKTWQKRVKAAEDHKKEWETENRVKECYNYWKGEQLQQPTDRFGTRRAQINKIHPEVRNNIPSLYYYRPFARLVAAPEQSDDPGTQIEEDTQLLQDTVNHIVRDRRTYFRESTMLGLKEAHWALGCVEVGYSAEFVDLPATYGRPSLKEKKDTKVSKPVEEEAPQSPLLSSLGIGPSLPPAPEQMPLPGMPPPEMGMGVPEMGMEGAPPVSPIGTELDAVSDEIAALQSSLQNERFYVKHIPAKQVLISNSDMPILECNDWVGYWEDVPLEDVKKAEAYDNTDDLEVNTEDVEEGHATKGGEDLADGSVDKIRLFKIWDLRTNEKIVLARGHDKFLMRKRVKRCNLKFLRFDIDPTHFLPRPLILSKLDPQDEYNASREYLRKVRNGTVPRYTYDEDAVAAKDMEKLESGEQGTYIPRKGGTSAPIEPIQQPSFSENAIQTLTLSDKEFADVGGVGNDVKVASTKTATQAKIGEAKNQAQDSFERQIVADWLAEICRELLALAIDNMSIDKWIAVNVAPDSQFAPQLADKVSQTFQRVNSEILGDAAKGIQWDVVIDLENLSPVSEEEKAQKFMTGLQLMGNPPIARLLSVSPELLDFTLKTMGIKSGRQLGLITGAIQTVVQMEQQLAAQGQNAAPGVSPQAGGQKPGAPTSPSPQPGGPAGPGASVPKPPAPPQAT